MGVGKYIYNALQCGGTVGLVMETLPVGVTITLP